MAVPAEYVGEDVKIRLAFTGSGELAIYSVQKVRVHFMGELGDITGSEDVAKKRKATVPDHEITLTKASFNPLDNMYAAPLALQWGLYVDVKIYPGGLTSDPYEFQGAIVADVDHDIDTQMLQPVTIVLKSGDGSSYVLPLTA